MPKISNDYHSLLWNLGLNFKDTMELRRKNSIKGSNKPNYLKYLALLNQIDDKYVLFVESLLSNKAFSNSKYCDYDLNVLLSTLDKDIFLDLYRFMSNETMLNSNHHIKDLDIISKTDNRELRNLLISKAIDKHSINSCYHDYDMEYISKLNFTGINKKNLELIHYYLFSPNGINHPKHIERLEKLLKGETIQSEDTILNYLENNKENIIVHTEKKLKVLSRIKQIFN